MDAINSLFSKPIVLGCSIALIVVSAINFVVPDAETIFGLVPVNTMIAHTYVWNLVTSQFFETNLIKLFLEMACFVYASRNLVFPSMEQFGFYFIVCLLGSSGATSFTYFVRFFATRLEEMILLPSFGFGGILMTMLLYARQQCKGQNPFESIPAITYHNLPILVIFAQLILLLLGASSFVTDLTFSFYSLLFGWSYLRFFYRYNVDSEVLGDNAEDFAFVAMFPTATHGFVVPLTTAFYNIVAMVGIFPELEQVEKKPYHHLRYTDLTTSTTQSLLESGGAPSLNASAPSVDLVQERRRAKAMKLLDAKMAELATEPDGWDDKDDESILKPSISSAADLDSIVSSVTSKRPLSSAELSNMKV